MEYDPRRHVVITTIAVIVLVLFFLKPDVSGWLFSPRILVNGNIKSIILNHIIDIDGKSLVFSLLRLLQFGADLESHMRRKEFIGCIIASMVLIPLIDTAISSLLYLLGIDIFYQAITCGLSGLIICLDIFRLLHRRIDTVSVYGVLNIKAKYYPFVIILIHLILSGVRSIVHILSAIIAGYIISKAMNQNVVVKKPKKFPGKAHHID